MQSSCQAIGILRMMTKSPPACSILRVLMLNHENSSDSVIYFHLRPIARTRSCLDLKASDHPVRRRSSSLLVVFVALNLIIWTLMENSSRSAASSPDPLKELEADVKVLKRWVRRQGHFLQQIDELGGRWLDRVDEDMGRIRSDLLAALQNMDDKVMTSLEHLNLRVQNLESIVSKLQETRNSG